MSLSWTRALRPAAACQAGIAIGRSQLTAVVLAAGGARPQVQAVHTQPLVVPLFEAQPGLLAEDALVQALRAVSAPFRERYAPVHVALPDFVLRSTVFELDQLPKKARLRQALLRWRFAKEWQRSEDSLDCRGDDLGPDGGRHLFFGQAGDSAWLACVRRALARAGISPWSLNAAAVYRFNGFHDTLAVAPGALLGLDPDSWSLLLWDERGRIRQVLTRLRENQPSGSQAAAIAAETERAILAYVKADGRRRVDRLHLAGDQADITALVQLFNARLSEPVLALHPDAEADAGVANLGDGLAPLALVAALSS